MAAAAAGVVAAVVLVRVLWPRQEAPRQRPPVPVELATARVGAITVTYPITGEVRAVASAQIRPEVSGIIERVYFREGQEVTAGQALLGLDRAPFLAALNQAIANSRKAAAAVQVAAAKARSAHTLARTARLRADRYSRLGSQGAVSRDQEDQFRSDADSLQAEAISRDSEVVSARADLAAAQAAEAAARLRYDRTIVRSPISGRTGQLRVTPGNLLQEGNVQPLLVVNQFRPIDVVFALPQRLLGQVRRGLPVRLEDGAQGSVSAIDNAVDPSTGTTPIKASFSNTALRLVPGQFVKGALQLERLSGVTLIPQVAVQSGQKGSFVYVAAPARSDAPGTVPAAAGSSSASRRGRAVEARNLELGPANGGLVVVRRGLAPGEQVVTRGQFALGPGARITTRSAGGSGSGESGQRSSRGPEGSRQP
ncbi:efflux RND transporter periplasmic adaptor subunit [Vulcanococcus limneticus Candia 3F8]|nr:efflux RND transporter periplasmic adaptor subunit [Vulcanococcus limneticus]MCP9792792.1 efflux RND transporter periplasmic adaptor subunit [Vulcanococcus limneticus MW73D5]MCP9894710.1 efflux RND transporter periplasmic adaptor subunit [Vulcanococcus limneticus Candia 3F8]MCP9898188.1 efflux RND transporter periplasmic adaptor subunit [Vulcanococcus limneticus Candia 3B3]